MAIDPRGFPLDLTAKNPRNEVTGDTRTLSSNADKTFIPDGGPFYTDTLIVRSGNRILKPIVDYVCLHLIKEATIESGYDVSAIVHIHDDTISTVTMQYQVVGGEYGNTVPVIRQLLENAAAIEKGVNWNTQVYAKPDVFPPAPHFVSGKDFSDWNDVVISLDNIHRGLAYKERASWNSFYIYVENLIKRYMALVDLSIYYNKTQIHELIGDFVVKNTVYTKNESQIRHYSKPEVDALIGDIDGNEFYYTENEINAKFLERTVAEGKFATIIALAKLDTKKADRAEVYTRAIADDKFALKTNVYTKEYIDATFTPLGLAYTKVEADERFARITAAYTKSQSDLRYALKSQIPQAVDLSKYITRTEVDDRYLKISTADLTFLRKSTADSLYAKISDLAIIQVLIKKFDNYYDKTTLDADFATKVYVANLYYNKTELNTTFASKAYTALNYLRITDFEAYRRDTAILINTKLDITEAAATYVEKDFLSNNYYTQRFLNDNFATLEWVRRFYWTAGETENQLKLKLDKTVFAERDVETWNEIATKATTSYVDSQYYNRVYTDDNFVRKTFLTSQLNALNATLLTKATYTWVNENFYNNAYIDRTFYTKADTEARFYSRAYCDANFLRKAGLGDELNAYVTRTDYNYLLGLITALTNNVYTKAESDTRYYSKAEADNRFALNTRVTSIENSLTALVNTKVTLVQVKDYTYSKAEVDNLYVLKSVLVRDYTNTAQLQALYGTKDYIKAVENNLIASINPKSDHAYAERTYLKASWINDNVYTKVESNNLFYTKTYCDNTYATKGYVNAEVAKMVTRTDWQASVNTIYGLINAKADTTWLQQNFPDHAYLSGNYPKTSWTEARYELKGSLGNYYTKAEANARFAPTDYVQRIENNLQTQINDIRNRNQYNVGDLYLTMIGYSSGAAVGQTLGYGTWARFGEGRALVGYSENGYVSGQSDSRFYYNQYANSLGGTWGVYNQWLSMAQMPAHRHSAAPFNLFVGMASDVTNAYGWQKYTNISFDNDNPTTELAIGAISATMKAAATEKTMGNSESHPTSQPSITIGVWRRIR